MAFEKSILVIFLQLFHIYDAKLRKIFQVFFIFIELRLFEGAIFRKSLVKFDFSLYNGSIKIR